MSKGKTISVILMIVALVGLSLYINRDALRGESIHVSSRSSPWMLERNARRFGSGLANPVTFNFDHYYRFTHIKVVAVSDIETNKYPHTYWDLDTTSNSAPLMTFVYGQRIPGMKNAKAGAATEPLEPDVRYRLLVTMNDNREATHDFTTTRRQP